MVDGRSDVYSLGAVFYKMLTGREPFFCQRVAELLKSIRSELPSSPREIEPSVPAELERICLKALEKRFGWLTENPKPGEHRTDVAEGYYSFPQGEHVAFYLVREKGIDMIGIPHKEMDIITYFLPD